MERLFDLIQAGLVEKVSDQMKSLEILEIMIKHRNSYGITLCDIDQIKQDLEVLEIFKALMFHNIKSIGFKSSIKSYEALFNMGIITKEQLEKLKQWLEENENER